MRPCWTFDLLHNIHGPCNADQSSRVSRFSNVKQRVETVDCFSWPASLWKIKRNMSTPTVTGPPEITRLTLEKTPSFLLFVGYVLYAVFRERRGTVKPNRSVSGRMKRNTYANRCTPFRRDASFLGLQSKGWLYVTELLGRRQSRLTIYRTWHHIKLENSRTPPHLNLRFKCHPSILHLRNQWNWWSPRRSRHENAVVN